MTKVRTDKYMMGKKRQARNKQFRINVQELEDTKWVIRIRILKKNRQHSGQKDNRYAISVSQKTMDMHRFLITNVRVS
jgi:hypothetical protein